MEYIIQAQRGLMNKGNIDRIMKCMQKANRGEKIVVGFLGGSITQGSLSSTPMTCYAYLVYEWWKSTFPQSEIGFINAGIGGTTSQFGVARVEEHLLRYKPDFILIEFAVNDDNTVFFQETYEGLVRKTYGDACKPAVLLMNNVRYDDGSSAEEMHLGVAKRYELPMVSMKSVIWPEVNADRIPKREITPDDLHPNDAGHRLIADVIIAFLESCHQGLNAVDSLEVIADCELPIPMTVNAYESSKRYQNHNSCPELEGFKSDVEIQDTIQDVFKNGWMASKVGDKITFSTVGTGIAVQYRKSIHKPTPIAKVIVDGMEDEAVILDGNFEEDWGDCLYIDTIIKHATLQEHIVEISIIEASEDITVPFYLVSVIVSR